MGANDYAPFLPNYGTFKVKNVAKDRKIIKIFNYPIAFGKIRDLLGIPGVSESDLRASLLKGEILRKIRAQEIEIIDSDIDLLQFNDDQKLFLQNAGIVKGLEVTGTGSGGWDVIDFELIGIKDNVNIIFTTSTKFKHDGHFKEVVHVNGLRQHIPQDYAILESGGPGTGYDTVVFVIPPYPDDLLIIDYYNFESS